MHSRRERYFLLHYLLDGRVFKLRCNRAQNPISPSRSLNLLLVQMAQLIAIRTLPASYFERKSNVSLLSGCARHVTMSVKVVFAFANRELKCT